MKVNSQEPLLLKNALSLDHNCPVLYYIFSFGSCQSDHGFVNSVEARVTAINQRSTICKQDLKMQALRTVQSYQYCIKCPINHTQERHIRDSSIWHHGRVLKICTALIYHYKYVDIIPFEDHNIKSPFLAPI